MAPNMAAIFRNSRWRPRWPPCRERFHKEAMEIIFFNHMSYFCIIFVYFVLYILLGLMYFNVAAIKFKMASMMASMYIDASEVLRVNSVLELTVTCH